MKEPSTATIFNELNKMTTPDQASSYIKNNINPIKDKTLKDFFDEYLAKNPTLNLSEIIKNSCVARTYAYEVFNGSKKASRDRIIALCYSAKMNVDEVNHALTYSNNSILYAKNSRDALIIMSINMMKNGNSDFQTVMQLNSHLDEHGMLPLSLSRES